MTGSETQNGFSLAVPMRAVSVHSAETRAVLQPRCAAADLRLGPPHGSAAARPAAREAADLLSASPLFFF